VEDYVKPKLVHLEILDIFPDMIDGHLTPVVLVKVDSWVHKPQEIKMMKSDVVSVAIPDDVKEIVPLQHITSSDQVKINALNESLKYLSKVVEEITEERERFAEENMKLRVMVSSLLKRITGG
jgi:hypothetical protein